MRYYYWINRWKQRETFKLEMSVVLLIKAMFLMLLWYLCFSHPLGDQLTDQQMTAHVITSSPTVAKRHNANVVSASR